MSNRRLWRITLLLWSLTAVLIGAILLLVFAPAESDLPSLALVLTPTPTQTSVPPSATPSATSSPPPAAASTPTPRATATQTRSPTSTATATRAAQPAINAAASAKLLFVGDVMLGRGITPIRKANGNGYPLAPVADLIRRADLAFGNLESPLTNITYFRGGYNLRAEPAAVESLALAGFDWVSVANNHSGDHGRAGLSETLSALRSKNIAWAGGGGDEAMARKPALKTVNGLHLALLAYDGTHATIQASGNQAGSQWLEVNRTIADIQNVRQNGADVVIVSIHWGVEYAAQPTASQRQIARQLALAGADLIIGHHPHVLGPLEWIARGDGRTSVVAYSLGNFLFDQLFSADVMNGAIMQAQVDRQGVAALNLIPTRHVGNQIRALSAMDGAALLARLLPVGALPAAWQRNARTDQDGRIWWHRP